jgi:hypothetical protein
MAHQCRLIGIDGKISEADRHAGRFIELCETVSRQVSVLQLHDLIPVYRMSIDRSICA